MRVWIAVEPRLGALDQDESVTGLMTRHVVEGEFPLLFWGQPYGGTAEVFLVASLFAAFGQSVFAGEAVAIGLHGLGAWLTWRIGRRTINSGVAAIGAALAWTWPTYAVWWSAHFHAFYPMSLVFGLSTVLFALRLAETSQARFALLAGLMAGLAIWTNPQTIFLIVPTVIWLLLRQPNVIRLAPIGVVAALVGATPLIWVNTFGEAQSLSYTPIVRSLSQYWDTLRGLFVQPIPAALGMRVSGSLEWVWGEVSGLVLYVAVLVGFWQSFRRRLASHNLVWCAVIGYIGMVALSEHAAYRAEPRYLYLIMPLLALLIAQVAKDAGFPILIPALLVVLSWSGLTVMSNFPKDHIVPANFTPVLTALEESGLTRVFAYHTIAYRIAFESQEEVIATPIDHVRNGQFDRLVRASPAPAYVFAPVPDVADALVEELRREGIPFSRVSAGDFVIVAPEVSTAPEQFEALSP